MVMGRPRSFDTDKALDEAMEVFWRHGYDGASLAMLTKAMGIKPPSLYAAFGSKEGLLKAALDRYAQRRSEHMRFVLAGETAHDVAERFLSSIAESHTDPANPPGCLLVQGGLACGAGSRTSRSSWQPGGRRARWNFASASSGPGRTVTSRRTPIRSPSHGSCRPSPPAWACWPPRAPTARRCGKSRASRCGPSRRGGRLRRAYPARSCTPDRSIDPGRCRARTSRSARATCSAE